LWRRIVGEAQAFGIETRLSLITTVFSKPAPSALPAPPQSRHVLHEAEGAGAAQFAAERVRIEVGRE
jgi:hypothetical protein